VYLKNPDSNNKNTILRLIALSVVVFTLSVANGAKAVDFIKGLDQARTLSPSRQAAPFPPRQSMGATASEAAFPPIWIPAASVLMRRFGARAAAAPISRSRRDSEPTMDLWEIYGKAVGSRRQSGGAGERASGYALF